METNNKIKQDLADQLYDIRGSITDGQYKELMEKISQIKENEPPAIRYLPMFYPLDDMRIHHESSRTFSDVDTLINTIKTHYPAMGRDRTKLLANRILKIHGDVSKGIDIIKSTRYDRLMFYLDQLEID